MNDLFQKIDTLKVELDSLRPIPEDRLHRLWQKLRLEWNYHSNTIEGNSLTLSETRTFILYGLTAQGKPFRDYVEMRGHNDALKKMEQIVHADLRITESLIKEFHSMILVEPYQDGKVEINPGEYKKRPNYLYSSTGERIDFEPPEEVARLMNELVNWTNNAMFLKQKRPLHPIEVAAYFHLRFINIHPFGDGNGRIVRIFVNLILMIKGYVPVIIRLENRDEYYRAIESSSVDVIEPLANFIALSLTDSTQLALKAAKGESIEPPIE